MPGVWKAHAYQFTCRFQMRRLQVRKARAIHGAIPNAKLKIQ